MAVDDHTAVRAARKYREFVIWTSVELQGKDFWKL